MSLIMIGDNPRNCRDRRTSPSPRSGLRLTAMTWGVSLRVLQEKDEAVSVGSRRDIEEEVKGP